MLFTGCSHKGILNIVNHVESLLDSEIHCVIGGMHLFNPISKKIESDMNIRKLAKGLRRTKVKNYYSCHCTGEKAYSLLKETLSTRLSELKTGISMEI